MKGFVRVPRYVVVCAALVAAACSVISPPDPGPCPKASIVADAARMTQFRPGPGQDLIDIQFDAEISRLDSSCAYNRAGDTITAVTSVRIIAARGPASNTTAGTMNFFVAVADSGQRVLARERFSSDFTLQRSQRRAGIVEEIEELIPLAPGQSGANFEILIGFELTNDQLEYNRRRQ